MKVAMTGHPQISGESMQEYLLIIKPDAAVCEKIADEKKQLLAEFGIAAGEESNPHIPVFHFFAREEMEETFTRWIQRICGRFAGFPVTLNNYSGFPHQSIYLRVQDHQPFEQLARQLRSFGDFIYPMEISGGKPLIDITPKLAQDNLEKTLIACVQKTFHESFFASELILLKRAGPAEPFITRNIFHFLPAVQEPAGNIF